MTQVGHKLAQMLVYKCCPVHKTPDVAVHLLHYVRDILVPIPADPRLHSSVQAPPFSSGVGNEDVEVGGRLRTPGYRRLGPGYGNRCRNHAGQEVPLLRWT